MGFRFIPRGLFKVLSRYEFRLRTPKKEDRYGDRNTIHSNGDVHVEIGPDGNVCAVWYRCRLLPFTQTRVIDSRASELLANSPAHMRPIKAIVFEEPTK